MFFVFLAAFVFIISSVIVYTTTKKRYIGEGNIDKVEKAQYLRAVFGVALFFTVVVMLVIKIFKS